ncbi:uncharacterized protein LOC111369871 isoform X2 [Olea europaea var. sylvestris]|uniref:uncharacterized protein LOC111369871 isoform X2 n=1 Tax=Olea europaea var. sylvestris TaxID=158386 RepID=UPI000C1D7816|nr:uncharacterized protein LOC111369871 isoform X2 [Olea europaea var. sylvestris]
MVADYNIIVAQQSIVLLTRSQKGIPKHTTVNKIYVAFIVKCLKTIYVNDPIHSILYLQCKQESRYFYQTWMLNQGWNVYIMQMTNSSSELKMILLQNRNLILWSRLV